MKHCGKMIAACVDPALQRYLLHTTADLKKGNFLRVVVEGNLNKNQRNQYKSPASWSESDNSLHTGLALMAWKNNRVKMLKGLWWISTSFVGD